MDENKSSFLMYLSFSKYFRMLTVEERGKLITAIFDYLETGTAAETLSERAEMIFEFIKDHLDRDAVKYQEKCDKNRANGKLGGRPKKQTDDKTERFNEKPSGFSENPTKPKKADTDTDTDTDTDSDKRAPARARESESVEKPVENFVENSETECESPPHQSDTYKASHIFSDLWEAYPPQRRGKRSEALNSFKEVYSPEVDYLAALDVFKASDEWRRESGRFVPALTKWLESRSWESEIVKSSTEVRSQEAAILKSSQARARARLSE